MIPDAGVSHEARECQRKNWAHLRKRLNTTEVSVSYECSVWARKYAGDGSNGDRAISTSESSVPPTDTEYQDYKDCKEQQVCVEG